ncbi:hypothetical protein BDF22DRAFT_656124 [Syncephalis plumigaleata]|nr:hypothetical protein BDF22DRAFT_656124 [Syncephalis plumigaleata]
MSTVYAIQFIRCFVTPTSFFQQLNLIDEWVIVIVQSVSIIVFFYYVYRESDNLSHMAFSCCLCFVFVAVYNATVTFLEWSSNIPMVIGMMLLLNIGNTIRSFVLLCVLGLRIPGLQTEQPTILLAALRHVTRKL